MLRVGQKVKYGQVTGEVTKVMEDTVFVKLEDGKEYSVQASQLAIVNAGIPKVYTGSDLKKMAFIESLAKDLLESGVSELTIKSGKVLNFQAKESLEEKIAKYKEEARAEAVRQEEAAEAKARKDFEDENKED